MSLSETPQGAIRFNTDSQKMEFYAQDQWWNMVTDADFIARPFDSGPGTRGLIGGGLSPGGGADHIQYINVDSEGNALEFGDFAAGSITHSMQAGSSRTRGIFAGGYRNNIEYVTITTRGNTVDFGDIIEYANNTSQGYCSNQTRMLTMGGYNAANGSPSTYAAVNHIRMIEIASLGNNQDFGDTTVAANYFYAAVASPTRAIYGQGGAATMEYVTIATKGNGLSFGTLYGGTKYSAHSNAVRGVFSGRSGSGNPQHYVTIATLGDSMEFGDMSVERKYNGATGSSTRGVIVSGTTPSYSNVMDSYRIMSQGNSTDFGDLAEPRPRNACLSNGHGGL